MPYLSPPEYIPIPRLKSSVHSAVSKKNNIVCLYNELALINVAEKIELEQVVFEKQKKEGGEEFEGKDIESSYHAA